MIGVLAVCWAIFWRLSITLSILVYAVIIIGLQTQLLSLNGEITTIGNYAHSAAGCVLVYVSLVISFKWSSYTSKNFIKNMRAILPIDK